MAYGTISRCVRGLPSRSRVPTVRAQEWEGVFHDFDKIKNNTIDGDELQQALKKWGYELSPPVQGLLRRKYGARLSFEQSMSSAHYSRLLDLDVNWVSEEAAAEGGALPVGDGTWSGITFDRFVRACVVVKQLNESFKKLNRDSFGRVIIDDFETFVNMVFKLP